MGMKRVLREILSTSIYLLVVLIAAYLIITFVGQRTQVNGSSMEATLSDGDNLFVDKLTYRFSDPERFDIVVFPYQYAPDTYYIKRVIGMPGETVQIDLEGNILITDKYGQRILDEDYGMETIKRPGRAIEPVVLGDDEYFVMGDNRNNSSDSREAAVGNIKRENIIGKAWLRVWPLSEFGFLKHK